MKNIKTIVATTVLTGILAVNSFAGTIIFSANENTDKKPQPCSVEKNGTIIFGTIIFGLVGQVVEDLTGVMISDSLPKCEENQRNGTIIF